MNVNAIRDVADLIEEKQRLTLRYFAAFVHGDPHRRDHEHGRVHGARVPTAQQLINNRVVDEHGFMWETTGCIAGWTNAMDDHFDLEDWQHAADVLGLDPGPARTLFFAQQLSTLWRSGRAAWSGTDYRAISAEHAVPTLRGIADGEIRFTGRGRRTWM
jgi:hypothetical protein